VENKITFPHNCAILGAVHKYAMEFCLKKNPSYSATSQCALVLISSLVAKPRVIYTVSPFRHHVSKKKTYER